MNWAPFQELVQHAPVALRPWLGEPGLLTARIRDLCGERMVFRLLGPLREVPLPEELRARLGLGAQRCLLREIEFRCDAARVVYAQTVLPLETVASHPWLRELGETPVGESLRRAGLAVEREPLECAELKWDSALVRAATQDPVAAGNAESALAPDRAPAPSLWARRAVYRLAGLPILVQEVFLPALLDVVPAASTLGQRRRG